MKASRHNTNLIVEFMGSFSPIKNEDGDIYAWRGAFSTISWTDFKYHEHYNALMPVVEKIESMCFDFNIYFDAIKVNPFYRNEVRISEGRNSTRECRILTNGETKLEAIYHAVILFIEWHNNPINK